MQVCKYAHICNYASMEVCTYINNNSEEMYMSAVAAFFIGGDKFPPQKFGPPPKKYLFSKKFN